MIGTDAPSTVVALALLFALGAALYSSVGHGGASAYIAAMALFSVAPETMKPTALALNLLVAGFGAWRYWRRGLTNWTLVLAFALTATPAAFISGGIHLPAITTSRSSASCSGPPPRGCCGNRGFSPSGRCDSPRGGSPCRREPCWERWRA